MPMKLHFDKHHQLLNNYSLSSHYEIKNFKQNY